MAFNFSVRPTLPAADIARAKKFYAEKLDMQPEEETPDGGLLYRCKDSWFIVYPTQFAGTAKNTAAGFETDNLDRDVKALRSRGVVFEEYDLPGLKTVNGIASFGELRGAWFKDSEGNILGLTQARDSQR
jgi:catechol 2,3-dioxygenase-like lactoylglutathione lyase family enzyme